MPQELSDESSMQEMFSLTVVNKLRMYVKKGKGLNASHQLWGELYDYVEINNVQLILFLAASAKKLNEKEQRVCYLVWMGFTPTEMSILLTTTKQNISTIRSRLLRKLFNVDGKSEDFDKKMKGFNFKDAVLTGVETRSSAPLRILRDETFQSNIKGLFPIGEGAGYAGGIMSSALDGINCAEKIIHEN